MLNYFYLNQVNSDGQHWSDAVAVRLYRDYRIASPSDRLELKKQAGLALAGIDARKRRKAKECKKRFFASRAKWQRKISHQAFLERQAKRAAAGMASHEYIASHD